MAYVGTPIEVGNQFSSLVGKRFSGDASTTAFTLDVRANSALDIEVFVENVRQDPNSAYTVDGTTLTFTAAPPSGTNNIYVVHQAPTVASVSPTAGSVTASSFDNTVISGHTALTAAPAATDELLISDAGTIKRIDYSVLGSTPAFEANRSADVTVGSGVTLKVAADTEKFDIGSCYDNSTNYRFTPNLAGKYFCYGSIAYNVNNAQLRITGELRKNGTSTHAASTLTSANGSGYEDVVAYTGGIVEFNGSSDYLEFFTFHNSGSNRDYRGSNTRTFFGAYRLVGV